MQRTATLARLFTRLYQPTSLPQRPTPGNVAWITSFGPFPGIPTGNHNVGIVKEA